MSGYDDKPKNDYYRSAKPERGDGLSFLLGLLAFGNFIFVVWLVNMWIALQNRDAYYSSYSSPYRVVIGGGPNPDAYGILGLMFIWSFLGFICIYGLWNLKRWGVYWFLGLFIVAIVFSLFVETVSGGVGSVVIIGVLFYLMKDNELS